MTIGRGEGAAGGGTERYVCQQTDRRHSGSMVDGRELRRITSEDEFVSSLTGESTHSNEWSSDDDDDVSIHDPTSIVFEDGCTTSLESNDEDMIPTRTPTGLRTFEAESPLSIVYQVSCSDKDREELLALWDLREQCLKNKEEKNLKKQLLEQSRKQRQQRKKKYMADYGGVDDYHHQWDIENLKQERAALHEIWRREFEAEYEAQRCPNRVRSWVRNKCHDVMDVTSQTVRKFGEMSRCCFREYPLSFTVGGILLVTVTLGILWFNLRNSRSGTTAAIDPF